MYSLVRASIAVCAMLVGPTQAFYRIQRKFSSKHVGVSVIINFIIIIIIIIITGAYIYVCARILVGQGVWLILLIQICLHTCNM
jgi:hypothetical protein